MLPLLKKITQLKPSLVVLFEYSLFGDSLRDKIYQY